ncbi:MAG: hypothetical protein ACE5EM_07515 [Sphingomonadales bacterium]
MSSLVKGDGRTHLKGGLMRESLVSQVLNRETEAGDIRGMVPDVNFLAIGGQSIMDRGAQAVLPLVDMIAKLRDAGHKLVVGAGGGARVRHTLAIGLDLGLPIGGLAKIVGAVEEQNRDILQILLAPHGGITFVKDHFQDLPMFLNGGLIPVCIGQPPYHYWEPPPREGCLPENGPDVGLFLMAELMGAKRLVLVKDVDGLYTADPEKDSKAELIPDITARDLIERDLPDLPVERELLRCLENARLLTEVHLINGLKPDMLERLFNGEPVGARIRQSGERGEG